MNFHYNINIPTFHHTNIHYVNVTTFTTYNFLQKNEDSNGNTLEMISCIVLSHGKVAEAVVDASKKIVGECSNLYAVSCEGLNPNALYEKLTHLIESENLRDGLFIFVGLRGESCWNIATKVVQNWEKVELISGLNLSMVLSFITKRNQYSFEELGEVLVRDGIRAFSKFNSKSK